jgi:ADP-ribose pyrophosphatase
MKKDNRALIYRGRVFDLVRRCRRLPGGRTARIEVIEHPGAALIVPFLGRGRVILLRQFRPAVNTWLYEFPAGTREDHESLLACARREIQEEAGYAASKISLLGRIYPVPGYATEKISIYKAEGLRISRRTKDRDEVIHARIFSRRQIRQLWRRGRIRDAKTICALAFCGWL